MSEFSPDQEAIARLRSVFDGNYHAVKWSRAHAAELFQRLESQYRRIAELEQLNESKDRQIECLQELCEQASPPPTVEAEARRLLRFAWGVCENENRKELARDIASFLDKTSPPPNTTLSEARLVWAMECNCECEACERLNHRLKIIAREASVETPRGHASDCAVHNAPAYPVGACSCGSCAWQPIETAPKTGELLICGGEYLSGYSDMSAWEPYKRVTIAYWFRDHWRGNQQEGHDNWDEHRPTLWMRVPQPQLETVKTQFDNVSCSQCGRDFGPGNHGFSHCENHIERIPLETKSSRCATCDDTGDVHRADGEWLGTCTCAAGVALKNKQLQLNTGMTHED